MNNQIRVNQLPESPEHGVVLRCWNCDENYSATRADYFWGEPDRLCVCGRCDNPLKLVIRIAEYIQQRV